MGQICPNAKLGGIFVDRILAINVSYNDLQEPYSLVYQLRLSGADNQTDQ